MISVVAGKMTEKGRETDTIDRFPGDGPQILQIDPVNPCCPACRGYDRNKPNKEKKMTTIKIEGMSCQHCVMAAARALEGIDGIRDVKVDLTKGEASFTEDKPVDRALIRERIVKAGFDIGG